MVDGHVDVWGAMVPPSGVRGIPAENVVINIWRNLQRVDHASCRVDGEVTGRIGRGLMVLLGVEDADTEDDMEWLARKMADLRIFSDDQGLMNRSVRDVGGGILLVSQFTLLARTKKGNRPSFIRAAKPEKAKPMYERMAACLSALLEREVQTGIFGADMQIDLRNDGPVTIVMDTRDRDNF